MGSIEIAVVGIGNCACSLIQGIEYYRRNGDGEHISANTHHVSTQMTRPTS